MDNLYVKNTNAFSIRMCITCNCLITGLNKTRHFSFSVQTSLNSFTMFLLGKSPDNKWIQNPSRTRSGNLAVFLRSYRFPSEILVPLSREQSRNIEKSKFGLDRVLYSYVIRTQSECWKLARIRHSKTCAHIQTTNHSIVLIWTLLK